jgi:hypothetical protein
VVKTAGVAARLMGQKVGRIRPAETVYFGLAENRAPTANQSSV